MADLLLHAEGAEHAALTVDRFVLRERLSAPFSLSIVAGSTHLDLEDLILRPASFAIDADQPARSCSPTSMGASGSASYGTEGTRATRRARAGSASARGGPERGMAYGLCPGSARRCSSASSKGIRTSP